jgi:hypothetical protein
MVVQDAILVLNHIEVFNIQRSAFVGLVHVVLLVAYTHGIAHQFDLLVVHSLVANVLLAGKHTAKEQHR